MAVEQSITDLTRIAVVALGALGCGTVFARFKQPAVVGYILAGTLLGPTALGLIKDRDSIHLLAELGVLMLLFLIGLELSIKSFKEVWRVALLTTTTQISLSLIVMWGVAKLVGWPPSVALLFGFVTALSSTAVAIKLLEDSQEVNSRVGKVTIGVLVAQDLAVVPMMIILASLGALQSAGENSEAMAEQFALDVGLKVGLSVGFLILLILVIGDKRKIHLPFLSFVGKSHDLLPLAGLTVCFGAAAVSGLLGLSPAYGAFLAGLIIGSSTARQPMIQQSVPIQSILMMLFFLSVGLLLDFHFVIDNLGTVLLLLFFVTVLKTLINVSILHLLGESWPTAFISGVTLAQMGEFSFLLAAVAVSSGLASPGAQNLIVAVTVLSLVTAPFYLAVARRLHGARLPVIATGRETLQVALAPFWRGLSRLLRQSEDQMVGLTGRATRPLDRLKALRRKRAEQKEAKAQDTFSDEEAATVETAGDASTEADQALPQEDGEATSPTAADDQNTAEDKNTSSGASTGDSADASSPASSGNKAP
ncbi:cation:proton antiporter [Rhodovibrionaceae bacterium A322]